MNKNVITENIDYNSIIHTLYVRLDNLYYAYTRLNSKYPEINRNNKVLLYLSYKNKILDVWKCFGCSHKCKLYDNYKLKLNNYLIKYPKNIVYE